MQQPKRINADLEDAVSPGGKARHIFHKEQELKHN